MVKILLLQGANLTFLGRREPEIYGSTTPAELDAILRCHAQDHAYQLEIFYTNIEGEAINRIYQAVDKGFDGLVMNPAGFTYAGFALKDCITVCCSSASESCSAPRRVRAGMLELRPARRSVR
jgi:3-dehydroquinate dehydratase-2